MELPADRTDEKTCSPHCINYPRCHSKTVSTPCQSFFASRCEDNPFYRSGPARYILCAITGRKNKVLFPSCGDGRAWHGKSPSVHRKGTFLTGFSPVFEKLTPRRRFPTGTGWALSEIPDRGTRSAAVCVVDAGVCVPLAIRSGGPAPA
jgi:hypothetical protein